MSTVSFIRVSSSSNCSVLVCMFVGWDDKMTDNSSDYSAKSEEEDEDEDFDESKEGNHTFSPLSKSIFLSSDVSKKNKTRFGILCR